MNRFAYKDHPAILGTTREWDIDLREFEVLGNASVSPTELALIPRFPAMGLWSGAGVYAEMEWRWKHDREALQQEVKLAAATREANRQAERERYDARLCGLTWEALLAEALFAHWSPSPPFPPSGFVEALRAQFRDAAVILQDLGPKPFKKVVRGVLRGLVEQINVLDEAHGQVVETEEREDLCKALGELAFLAHQPGLTSEIDAWRSW